MTESCWQIFCHFAFPTPSFLISLLHIASLGNAGTRIIESQRFKKTFEVIESNHGHSTASLLLNHTSKHHIRTYFEYFQRQWFHHFPGQSLPMLDHCFSEEISPNILPLTSKGVPVCYLVCVGWDLENILIAYWLRNQKERTKDHVCPPCNVFSSMFQRRCQVDDLQFVHQDCSIVFGSLLLRSFCLCCCCGT